MELLYLLIAQNGDCYKVGITNDLQGRIKSIESKFGKLNQYESLIYSCSNRKLIEEIEGGIHAYLSDYVFHPSVIGGGSTEWFRIESLHKAKDIISMYQAEVSVFNLEGTLGELIKLPIDYQSKLTAIQDEMMFAGIHQNVVNTISKIIVQSKGSIVFRQLEGKYILQNLKTDGYTLGSQPRFEWARLGHNYIEFDIVAINEWKSAGIHRELRQLIEIKFFNKFNLKNINSMSY
jgi:T5orf172 domain